MSQYDNDRHHSRWQYGELKAYRRRDEIFVNLNQRKSKSSIAHISKDNLKQIDARIKAHRERVTQDFQRLSRGLSPEQIEKQGLTLGNALKVCIYCQKETVETGQDAAHMGWVKIEGGELEDYHCGCER